MLTSPWATSGHAYSLMRLGEALTCGRAVAVIAASAVSALLLGALGGALANASWGFVALFGLLAVIVLVAGFNGAGICLTDLVHSRPMRTVPTYILTGVFSLPRLLGAAILIVLTYLGVVLVVAVALAICKIPGLGPVLLVAVIPLSVLAVALTLVAMYVATTLVAPAIWNGERVFHALGISWAIARRHPFEVLVKILAGLLLSGLFGSLLFGTLFTGSLVVGGLAVPILGSGMNMGFNVFSGGGAGGVAAGMGIGYGLVFALAGALVSLLPLMLGVLTWAEYSEKVDLASLRQTADGALDQMSRKVNEVKERGQAAGASLGAATQKLAAREPEAAPQCPQCRGVVQPDDRYCEHCGHALR